MLTVPQHHIDVLRVVEVAMQLDYIWMVESPLNFELTLHLAEEIKLLQDVLEYDFECTLYATSLLNCFEDLAEFTTANGLDPREIIHCPSLLFCCTAAVVVIIVI